MTDSSTTIETGGGIYVGGDAQAGRDLIGRDQIIYGATPAEFTAMLTRLFGLMVEIPQARTVLLGARTVLEQTRLHLRRLAEYKEVHDLLQQLESSYVIVYSLIYDEGGLLSPTLVRWQSLRPSCNDLQSSIQRVCHVLGSTSFAADVTDWQTELTQVATALPQVHTTRDLEQLDLLLVDVNRVISTQTPRMNDRLIGVVDSLQLTQLADRLLQMHGDLLQARNELAEHQAERLEDFGRDVARLGQWAIRLTELRHLHDRWQQADNELRAEQATLVTVRARFQTRWQRSLKQRLHDLCVTAVDEHERELAQQIVTLEHYLTQPELVNLLEALDGCRRAVSLRLSRIDHDLHTLCKLLKEAGGPLDTLLEKLV